MIARTWLCAAAGLLVGCRSQPPEVGPQACAPSTSSLPASGTATGLAGDYELRLVATSGAKTGAAAEGTLRLQPQRDSLLYLIRLGGVPDSTVTHPLYGSVDLNLAAVDAVSVGSTNSTDPIQPGVLVIERHPALGQSGVSGITIRLGSEANRRDRQRFDGGYTALRVQEASPERLLGTWASGVSREHAAGYFCAVRTDGRGD